MRRFLSLLFLLVGSGVFGADQSVAPVAGLSTEAARLVSEWWEEGTAAGNFGDYYDNRDRGHATINLKNFPQLSKITYSSNEIASRLDYGSPRKILTNVVVANSSTSRGVLEGGSNTRGLYASPVGAALAYELYVFNNLHCFPEHQDHDPGHGGTPGYGDVFPLNTPYFYTSQGSSSSELKFVETAFLTLAAFRPEVKAKLVQRGLLLPTVQMLLRQSYKPRLEPVDYLSGLAHPTVFESSRIDAAAMVRAAHGITLQTLPPIAKLRVIEEDRPRNGIDFFDLRPTEVLCDTPCAIGRVFRGHQRKRRMVVSADASFDQNIRPLTWHWSVLRGDTNRIQIKPLNARSSMVEITVAHHERRAIYPGAEVESNRIDIGCFVHNGAYYSAPAFVCYYFPDNEGRGYDEEGKILDVGYDMGQSRVEISDWKKIFELVEQNGVRAEFLRARLPEGDWQALQSAGIGYGELLAAEKAAIEARKPIEKELNSLNAQIADLKKKAPQRTNNLGTLGQKKLELQELDQAAQKKITAASRAVKDHLEPARRILTHSISNWIANPNFTFSERRDLDVLYKSADRPARETFEAGKELLITHGLMEKNRGMEFSFTPLRTQAGPLEDRLTPYERCLVERLNAAVISLLILRGAATSKFVENYSDGMITARKNWRDVYRYGSDGKVIGWTRYTPGADPAEFNAEGGLMEKGKAVKVLYIVKAEPNSVRRPALTWTRQK